MELKLMAKFQINISRPMKPFYFPQNSFFLGISLLLSISGFSFPVNAKSLFSINGIYFAPDNKNDTIITEKDFKKAKFRLIKSVTVTPPTNQVRVAVHQLTGYETHEAFARESATLLERIVNSTEFKDEVLKGQYFENKGYTSEHIYNLIFQAQEQAGPGGTNGVIDLRLRTISMAEDGAKWIRACNKNRKPTIGKDGGRTGITATCPNWVANRVAKGEYSHLAGHYMHEYLHILGFSHFDKNTKYKSVPYRIGYLVRDLALKLERPLKGKVTQEGKFETKIDGKKKTLVLYTTSMQILKEELLDLSAYIGKKVSIKVELYTDTAAYGAIILK